MINHSRIGKELKVKFHYFWSVDRSLTTSRINNKGEKRRTLKAWHKRNFIITAQLRI